MNNTELTFAGLQETNLNREIAHRMCAVAQHPEGYGWLASAIKTPFEPNVPTNMRECGLTEIIHAEGESLWHHVLKAMNIAQRMELEPELKRLAVLTLFVHDLGKAVVDDNERNRTATDKKLARGEVGKAFIGHADACLDEVRDILFHNFVSGQELDRAVKVVELHMSELRRTIKDKALLKLVAKLGDTEDERHAGLELLCAVVHADKAATDHAVINEDGTELVVSNDTDNLLTFDQLWGRYTTAEATAEKNAEAQAQTEKKKAKADGAETVILGCNVGTYCAKCGIKGAAIRDAMATVKRLLAENAGMNNDELKALIDANEL